MLQRTAIAIRHLAFENLGLLAPIMEREGWNVAYCDAPVDDLTHRALREAELLVVLGGPIGVYEADNYPFLTAETSLIEYRLRRDLPMLGICLGSQLMASALGARVFPGHVKEIGWGAIDLTPEGSASCLRLLGKDRKVLHWHGDTFDLPDGAERLASNLNYENQAFSFGRNALALQFHLEAKPQRLEEWYVGHAVELAAAKVSVPALRAATSELSEAVSVQAEDVFTDWLRGIDVAKLERHAEAGS